LGDRVGKCQQSPGTDFGDFVRFVGSRRRKAAGSIHFFDPLNEQHLDAKRLISLRAHPRSIMKKTSRRFSFHATNLARDVAIISYPSGNTMLSCTRFGETFTSQVDVPGIEKSIALYPAGTLWQANLSDVPPSLEESVRDHLLIILKPGPHRPPLIAFCRRRIARAAAEALLAALPEIAAVGCSEGLILRQGITLHTPNTSASNGVTVIKKEAAHAGR
jgi:hypothetical protein